MTGSYICRSLKAWPLPFLQNCYNFIRYIAWILVYHMRPAMIFYFCLFLEWFVWYKNKQFRMFFYKIICGGISFCKPPYCSISHLEAREYFGLCGNKAFSETIMCVNFFSFFCFCVAICSCWWIRCRCCGAPLDIWGAQQLRTGCLSILMFLAPLAEVTP